MGKARAITADATPDHWSDWRAVPGLPSFTAAVAGEILDGGQAFRWYRTGNESWIGAWGESVVRLRLTPRGTLEWSAPATLLSRGTPATSAAVCESALKNYLGLATDFTGATDALPWRSDPHLAQCIAAFPGLRILRQPFGETLLGFLCSATKQIVQIKQMLALLAARHGDRVCTLPLASTPGLVTAAGVGVIEGNRCHVHALPSWPRLAAIPEAKLRECLLGFRARYIAETARFLAAHPGWLEETETMPYADAKARLCAVPGVGEKVADCVLLFGAGRLEAFPVDVWILKTLAKRYGLDDWKPAPLAQFGRVHFGQFAGLAQQYLFAWERRIGRREPTV